MQRRFPSIPAKTLLPATMGFGWRGTVAALLHQARCFPHYRNKDAYMQTKHIASPD
ncbi:MAG: hypothetical protein OEY25_02315 [Candidatus Aminicenantes bacterium]|nr:hypothetical protein [Candidatus Aminicenantes bacterium]MDH5466230.1 hypothetical protein [Candidatus Aminicenantes bacterium]MDH5704915.1 hypothetical protein [Candidatus Aminicenantes bacterium]